MLWEWKQKTQRSPTQLPPEQKERETQGRWGKVQSGYTCSQQVPAATSGRRDGWGGENRGSHCLGLPDLANWDELVFTPRMYSELWIFKAFIFYKKHQGAFSPCMYKPPQRKQWCVLSAQRLPLGQTPQGSGEFPGCNAPGARSWLHKPRHKRLMTVCDDLAL